MREKNFFETNAYEWINVNLFNIPNYGLVHHHHFLRTVCDNILNDKSGDWPAIVTLFEANAYCNWKGNGARIIDRRRIPCHI